jgi:hypothetical protein
VLNDDGYRRAALKAGRFIWDNLRQKDGTLLRSYFTGRAEIDAELVDYAWLGRAFIELYDLSGDDLWLGRARMLFDKMEILFADKNIGDFFSSQKVTSFGRPKSRQDSDLASGNGIALALLVALAARTDGPELKRRTEKLLASLSGFAAGNVAGGASILTAADNYFRGESGPVQYGGGGTVRAQASFNDNGSIAVKIKVAEGWHINAHKPLEDYLVPTTLKVKSDVEVIYPMAKTKRLGFSKNPLALLEGELEIRTQPVAAQSGSSEVKLEIQACSDQICLAPDSLKFSISPPPG